MANQVKVAMQQTIITLHRQGWSNRRIARELGLHRETVRGYVNRHKLAARSKAAIPPPGSEACNESKAAIPPPGSEACNESKAAISPPGSGGGRRSCCEGFAAQIDEWLGLGLSAQRIYQDLVAEHDFGGSYYSVKRFVRKRRVKLPAPFRRWETAPGVEAQVDFGRGAPVLQADGHKRHPKVFRIVLSHSRKGYSEAVWQESTEAFIRALENAFRYFGGVTEQLVVDNLKAAVLKADWFDPELHPKIRDFCAHYHTVMLPTRPYTPRHKGKVEGAVKYVRNNALKGRCFRSLAEENAFLSAWETKVADTRIHGTTREQVRKAFDREQPALQPLPDSLFPCFEEGRRQVHRDGHIEVAKAYYSVPPEYVKREVRVRWDLRIVRIFNQRGEQIAMHARSEPGRFNTNHKHIPEAKISQLERGQAWQLDRAGMMGGHARQWAESMLKNRGIQGLRVLQGLLGLRRKYAPEAIDTACAQALGIGVFHLKHIRQLLKTPRCQQPLDFLEEHELIRGLDFYGHVAASAAANRK